MTPRDADANDEEAPRPPGRRHKRPVWQETLFLIGLALVLAVVIKAAFVQAFYIPSESMEPGLIVNDRILVQKPSYWGPGGPERGDIVVFDDPGGWLDAEQAGPTNPLARALGWVGLYPQGGHLVKRVIGVAGDTIVCCDEQGLLELNGEPLDESDYVVPQTDCNGPMPTGRHRCDWEVGPIPEGSLFVMGDNRSRSADSTVHLCAGGTDCVAADAYVPVDRVVGKVMAVVWPGSHFRLVHRPAAFAGVPDGTG